MSSGARNGSASLAAAGPAAAALGIAVLTAVARVAGFGRTVVFAHTVGATCLGDTYVTANTVPNIVFEVVAGGALASLVVPVLAGAVARGDHENAGRTASALLSWALLLAVPVTVAGIVVARPLIGVLVGSGGVGCARGDEVTVGARMLLVFMPQVVFYAICVVLTGILQAHRRFLAPALGPLVSSVVVIAAYLTFAAQPGHRGGLASISLRAQLILSIGTTLGVVALTAPLLVPIAHIGIRLRPTLRFPVAIGRRVAALAFAGAATLAAQQLSVAVVVRLAHRGSGGSLVLYNLASTVFLVPWAVLAVPIATTAFPRLVASIDRDDVDAYRAGVARGVRVVILISAAGAAALAAASAPIAHMLVLGAPGDGDTRALALTITALAPGLVGYGLVAYVGRALYARASWRVAAIAICAGWVSVIIADVVLVAAFSVRWRVVALGIGNTVGMTIAGVLLLGGIRVATGSPSLAGLRRTMVGAITGAAVGLVLGYLVSDTIHAGSVGVAVVVGIATVVVASVTSAAVAWRIEPPESRALLLRYLPLRKVAVDG
jgi:putative peptidoglycan lipid II flippase